MIRSNAQAFFPTNQELQIAPRHQNGFIIIWMHPNLNGILIFHFTDCRRHNRQHNQRIFLYLAGQHFTHTFQHKLQHLSFCINKKLYLLLFRCAN